VTREMPTSPSTVPTKTDRAVKLPTSTVVRELPRRRGKRHATSRWTSRSYCHTREALLRCSTARPAGRLTRCAMALVAVGSLERPHGKIQKIKCGSPQFCFRNRTAPRIRVPFERPAIEDRGGALTGDLPAPVNGSVPDRASRWWCAASGLQSSSNARDHHRRPRHAGRRD
jgi:hypothetical protein